MKVKRPTVGILSLGCPRNIVDSESILGRLKYKGYPLAKEISDADIAIVNTCAFIEEAKKESIDALLELIDLKKQGRIKKIIVYGCLSQRYSAQLVKELPQIDAFIGKVALSYDPGECFITARHYGYLKICEGCINRCSYCAIPAIKGKLSSLDIDSVLKKARVFNRQGVSELNIIGQDITGYGVDLYQQQKLPQLVKKIVKVTPDIPWLRLLYLYPSRVSDELIELIADEPRICKYIDLPLQHINDRILKLMRRQTTTKAIFALIAKIRKKIPQAALRTSFIVGFPSETKLEFKELLNFIEEVKFERLGVFIYSKEEGTPAYNFKGQVPHRVKVERFNKIMSAQQSISREINEKFMHRTIDVLIDEKEGQDYLGRSQYDAPEVDGTVHVKSSKPLSPGDFVQVKITDTLEYDLVGVLENKKGRP